MDLSTPRPTRLSRAPVSLSSPVASPMEVLGANAGAAATTAGVLPSSNPTRPQSHPHPPPPIISISPPSTPGSPLHSPIDIADASFERFHATRRPNSPSIPYSGTVTHPSDRRASLYDSNEKNLRSSLESDLDLDLELDLGLDFIDDDDSDFLRKMAGYTGQSRIRGSTETMQMVLLTFVMIGITCVPFAFSKLRNNVTDFGRL